MDAAPLSLLAALVFGILGISLKFASGLRSEASKHNEAVRSELSGALNGVRADMSEMRRAIDGFGKNLHDHEKSDAAVHAELKTLAAQHTKEIDELRRGAA
jgi:signal transduction histidine kinase